MKSREDGKNEDGSDQERKFHHDSTSWFAYLLPAFDFSFLFVSFVYEHVNLH